MASIPTDKFQKKAKKTNSNNLPFTGIGGSNSRGPATTATATLERLGLLGGRAKGNSSCLIQESLGLPSTNNSNNSNRVSLGGGDTTDPSKTALLESLGIPVRRNNTTTSRSRSQNTSTNIYPHQSLGITPTARGTGGGDTSQARAPRLLAESFVISGGSITSNSNGSGSGSGGSARTISNTTTPPPTTTLPYAMSNHHHHHHHQNIHQHQLPLSSSSSADQQPQPPQDAYQQHQQHQQQQRVNTTSQGLQQELEDLLLARRRSEQLQAVADAVARRRSLLTAAATGVTANLRNNTNGDDHHHLALRQLLQQQQQQQQVHGGINTNNLTAATLSAAGLGLSAAAAGTGTGGANHLSNLMLPAPSATNGWNVGFNSGLLTTTQGQAGVAVNVANEQPQPQLTRLPSSLLRGASTTTNPTSNLTSSPFAMPSLTTLNQARMNNLATSLLNLQQNAGQVQPQALLQQQQHSHRSTSSSTLTPAKRTIDGDLKMTKVANMNRTAAAVAAALDPPLARATPTPTTNHTGIAASTNANTTTRTTPICLPPTIAAPATTNETSQFPSSTTDQARMANLASLLQLHHQTSTTAGRSQVQDLPASSLTPAKRTLDGDLKMDTSTIDHRIPTAGPAAAAAAAAAATTLDPTVAAAATTKAVAISTTTNATATTGKPTNSFPPAAAANTIASSNTNTTTSTTNETSLLTSLLPSKKEKRKKKKAKKTGKKKKSVDHDPTLDVMDLLMGAAPARTTPSSSDSSSDDKKMMVARKKTTMSLDSSTTTTTTTNTESIPPPSTSTTATTSSLFVMEAAMSSGLQQQQQQQQQPTVLNNNKKQRVLSSSSTSSSPLPNPVVTAILRKTAPQAASAVAAAGVGGRGGTEMIPHHSERSKHALGIDEDHNWLSEFQCYARSEMMEVFQATKADVVVRSTSKSVKLNQVGVRCRFCAHIPHADRVNRSSAFPSGLSKIYQSFNMMVRDHFANCTEVPASVLQQYLTLKAKNSQGACDSRHYWFYAATKLGLIDTDNGKGIDMNDETKAAALKMPPYGTATSANQGGGKEDSKPSAAAAAALSELEGKEVEPEDLSLIRQPKDLAQATPFLAELLSQLQIVRLLPSERVGKRKTLPIGLEGFGCRYCYHVGRLGFSRCYPLRRRGLSAQIYDMHLHLQRCTVCPKSVQMKLKQLEPPAAAVAAAKKPSKDYAGTNAWYGEDTEFMDMVWARLGRTNDLTT